MPPKPGNAFAQQKYIQRRTSQRMQQHTRDFSSDTTSSATTVRMNPDKFPQEESSAATGFQDMPETPRTTMAMFAEESDPEQGQEISQECSGPGSKIARKRKERVEAKYAPTTLQDPLLARSSAMPEPLYAGKQSGLDFIKSTLSKGRRAFAKTTPISISQPETAFAPFDFQQRQIDSQQSTQSAFHPAAASNLQTTDPAVLYAKPEASPRVYAPGSYVSAVKFQQPAPPSIEVPTTTSQKSAFSTTHVPAVTSHLSNKVAKYASATTYQPPALHDPQFPTIPSEQLHTAALYASGTASQQTVPSSMQIPQSAIPDRYRLSSAYGQRDSKLPSFQPHAGMMPYSRVLARRHDRQGHLSTGTQQTYATTQSHYTPINQNEGIILGGTSISPTRQGTYAVAGNAELVSRPSVTSMTGIVSEVSPTTQNPQQQSSPYSGPEYPSKYQPRLDAPLPSLPASASEDQSIPGTQTTPYSASSTSHPNGGPQLGHNSAITGTWERMQAQYPSSMPKLSPLPLQYSTHPMVSDPPYIITRHGPIAASLLYNFNATDDTKSEGQKSDLEASDGTHDTTDDNDGADRPTSNVKHLLRKSAFRGAFSSSDLNLDYRKSSLNAEAPVFVSSSSTSGDMQTTGQQSQSHVVKKAPSTTEAKNTTAVRDSAQSTQVTILPETSSHVRNAAASARALSPNLTTFDCPSADTPKHDSPVVFQAVYAPATRILPNTSNETTFGGFAPTPPHPIHQSTVPASQQIAASFAVLHHRLERDNRVLREHINTATNVAQDRLFTYLDEKLAGLEGRVEELGGNVAALRQQIAKGSGGPLVAGSAWPLPGASLSAPAPHIPQLVGREGRREGKKREKGVGKEKGKEKGKGREKEKREEEVLWRRPAGGLVGDIGARWYEAEVGE